MTTESKVETPFDKGARILNAVIAEVDLPADLKASAQSVIRILAEFLPQMLATPADAPVSGATTTASSAPDDAVSVEWLNNTMDRAKEARPARTRAERRSRVRSSSTSSTQEPTARTEPAVACAQEPQAALAGVPEADVQLIWNTYTMVTGLQRNQADRLSETLALALRARVDTARVVEILTSASIGAAQLWRAALDDLAKA